MKNVLLVTSPLNEAPQAIAYAVQQAKDLGGELIALAVLDPDLTRRIATTLTNVGFLGEKVSNGVMDTLAREQRGQAEALLKRVGDEAARQGVACTPLIEEGDPSEVCSRVIRSHGVESAILVAEKRSWLTRFLSRSAAVRLPALAGCEVKVMED
jgi:Universal stress protein family